MQPVMFPQPSKAVKHFDFSLKDDDLEGVSKGLYLVSTEDVWTWIKYRNEGKRKEPCPTDQLSTNDNASILLSLAQFVTEARCLDGKPYPPKTIHMLLTGLQGHLCTLQPSTSINIFTDTESIKSQNCLYTSGI